MAGENQQAEMNPFSPEKAWMTYQENMTEAERLRAEIREGLEQGAPERELLLKAAEAIGRLTDNTILRSLIQKALEAREAG